MIDINSKEEAVKHLSHIKGTYGINLEQPVMAIRSDYAIRLYYLGNEIFYINTRPLDIKIDDLFKEDKE